MAMTQQSALEMAADAIGPAMAEFDLGMDFVAKEVASAADNEFIEAYVGGMVEEAVRQLLMLTPAKQRLELAGEMQAVVLQLAIEMLEA